MRSFSRLVLLALPFVSRVACNEPASQTKGTQPLYRNAHEAFQDLLNALPEESLHVALNSLGNFKDGVFESDRHGVEKVHEKNPPLATKLIVAAVQDLKKRQTPSNSTVIATSAEPTSASQQQTSQQQTSQAQTTEAQSSQPQSTEAQPSQAQSTDAQSSEAPATTAARSTSQAVVVPVEATTTNEQGSTVIVTSSILSKATASVAVVVTTTDSAGSTVVATTTKPAAVITTTDSAGSVMTTTSAVDFQPTSGQVITTTNAQGSTFLTTYTPSAGKVSSIELITSTGVDGKPTVVTSYTYVDPAAATTAAGSATGTQAGSPGLQSGVAVRNRGMEAAVLGGAVGGAFALFI